MDLVTRREDSLREEDFASVLIGNREFSPSPSEKEGVIRPNPLPDLRETAVELVLQDTLDLTDYRVFHTKSGLRGFLLETRESVSVLLSQGAKRLALDNEVQKSACFLRCESVVMTFDVVDELVRQLTNPDVAYALGVYGKSLVFVNPGPGVIEALDQSFWMNKRVGMIYNTEDDKFSYVGNLPNSMKVVLDLVISHGPMTSVDVARDYSSEGNRLSVKDASNRLRSLGANGLIVRSENKDKDGFRYSYFNPRDQFRVTHSAPHSGYEIYKSKTNMHRF